MRSHSCTLTIGFVEPTCVTLLVGGAVNVAPARLYKIF